MNLIAIFGGATIVGAALIIIVPEASSILINAQLAMDRLNGIAPEDPNLLVTEDMSGTIGTAIMLGFAIMLIINQSFVIIQEKMNKAQEEEEAKQQEETNLGINSEKEPLMVKKET